MKHIAKALAAQGRGPDTELLHVTKRELKHLATLAGRDELPVNPKTGLPEAGLFESILPIVGGIAGGAMLGPWGAALGSGLGTKVAGGSDTDALRAGALSGIGSSIMQGLSDAPTAAPVVDGNPVSAAALTNPAAQAAAATPTAPAGLPASGAMPVADPLAAPGALPYTSVPTAGIPYGAASAPAPVYDPTGMFAATPPAAAPTAAPSGFMNKAMNWAGEHPVQAGILGLGAVNALTQPEYKQPEKRWVEMKGQATSQRQYTGGAPAAGANPYAERTYFSSNSPYQYTEAPSTYEMRYVEGGLARGFAEGGAVQPQGYQHTQFQSAYQPGLNTQVAPGTASPAMQAAFSQPSGIASLPAAGTPTAGTAPTGGLNFSDPNWYQNAAAQTAMQNPYESNVGALTSGAGGSGILGKLQDNGLGYLATGQFIPGMGSVGHAAGDFVSNTLGSIGGAFGFAKGGKLNLRAPDKKMDPVFLKGPGDGMSDSIPAYIDGGGVRPHEPIRVATNEYVVPADVVSHLGNGSSDAGAKKLDQMSAKVRKARTGKKTQAPQINPDKHMPK